MLDINERNLAVITVVRIDAELILKIDSLFRGRQVVGETAGSVFRGYCCSFGDSLSRAGRGPSRQGRPDGERSKKRGG